MSKWKKKKKFNIRKELKKNILFLSSFSRALHRAVSKYIIRRCWPSPRCLNFLLPHQFHKVFIAFSWPFFSPLPPFLLRGSRSKIAELAESAEMDPRCSPLSVASFLTHALRHSLGSARANLMVVFNGRHPGRKKRM